MKPAPSSLTIHWLSRYLDFEKKIVNSITSLVVEKHDSVLETHIRDSRDIPCICVSVCMYIYTWSQFQCIQCILTRLKLVDLDHQITFSFYNKNNQTNGTQINETFPLASFISKKMTLRQHSIGIRHDWEDDDSMSSFTVLSWLPGATDLHKPWARLSFLFLKKLTIHFSSWLERTLFKKRLALGSLE